LIIHINLFSVYFLNILIQNFTTTLRKW